MLLSESLLQCAVDTLETGSQSWNDMPIEQKWTFLAASINNYYKCPEDNRAGKAGNL